MRIFNKTTVDRKMDVYVPVNIPVPVIKWDEEICLVMPSYEMLLSEPREIDLRSRNL